MAQGEEMSDDFAARLESRLTHEEGGMDSGTTVLKADLRALLDHAARQAEMLEGYKRLLDVSLNTKISAEETERLRKELGL